MSEARTVSIEEACRQLGIGRTLGYELARSGSFPCRILKIGKVYRVPAAHLWSLLSPEGVAVPAAAHQ